MSAVDRTVTELLNKGSGEKNDRHTQTISLDNDTHDKLVNLSKTLGVSKTALASRLLTAAIKDANRKISTEPNTENNASPGDIIPAVSQQPRRKAARRR